jgi:hypothetical protein
MSNQESFGTRSSQRLIGNISFRTLVALYLKPEETFKKVSSLIFTRLTQIMAIDSQKLLEFLLTMLSCEMGESKD